MIIQGIVVLKILVVTNHFVKFNVLQSDNAQGQFPRKWNLIDEEVFVKPFDLTFRE